MPREMNKILTKCRSVTIGGNTKQELYQVFQKQSIMMNDYAKTLFDSEHLVISSEKYTLDIVMLTVEALGFPHGAKMKTIINKAKSVGLHVCPLELGPYMRLTWLEQPAVNSHSHSKSKKAPYGSVTIISDPVCEHDNFPKGFYLRNIDGVLWLRGYLADDEHIWNPDDYLLFTGH